MGHEAGDSASGAWSCVRLSVGGGVLGLEGLSREVEEVEASELYPVGSRSAVWEIEGGSVGRV